MFVAKMLDNWRRKIFTLPTYIYIYFFTILFHHSLYNDRSTVETSCFTVSFYRQFYEILTYKIIGKSFQNDEKWRLFYQDSTFSCRVIKDFGLCKLDDLWRHIVDNNKIWNICASLQGWNFAGSMCCKNYTFW